MVVSRKRVLFIAYFFPPMGGAGVQRTAKFVKYLPELGYEAHVVGGDGTGEARADDDPTLFENCPTAAVQRPLPTRWEKLLRRVSSIPGGRWSPWFSEGLSWWVSAAIRAGAEALRRRRFDVILVSGSPFSAARVGEALSKRYRVPWVLDLRDPWALDPIRTYPTVHHHRRARREMLRACGSADAVIMNTASEQSW